MATYFIVSLLLVGIYDVAFERVLAEQTSYSTQNMPLLYDSLLVSKKKICDSHVLQILFSKHQSDDNSIIEEADRIFDSIVETHGTWTFTITPDMEYFNFFADNFAFFRSHSTQQDDGIYDYRLPTSDYLHVKDFRFVVDTNQNLKLVVVQSAFL